MELFTTIVQESMNARRRALNHKFVQKTAQPELPEQAATPVEEPDTAVEDAPFFPEAPRMKGRKKKSSAKESPWRFWRW